MIKVGCHCQSVIHSYRIGFVYKVTEIFLESIKSNISKMYYFWLFELMDELELCAFALKGEHNVYSLVPNIAVCYIDTKFSYDNNVYFSIFCEHRQLKHVVLCG